MAEPLQITLSYHGPAADEGTLPVHDAISALQGFAGAYNKVATVIAPNADVYLEVGPTKKGSWEVALIAFAVFGLQPNQQELVQIGVDVVKRVFFGVVSLVNAKKHVEGKPFEISVTGSNNVAGNNNNVTIINAEKLEIQLPKELLTLFTDRIIDSDLNKIASPLRTERIERAQMSAGDDGGLMGTEILEAEKRLFEPSASTATITTAPGSVVRGVLVSLNKENNRGTFRLQDGHSIPYEYHGSEPYNFHRDFARRGLVSVTGEITLNEQSRPMRIKIQSVERIQGDLDFGGTEQRTIES